MMELNSNPIDFKLKNVDGKYYSLSDFADAKYLVLIFSCNHCPYVVGTEREFIQIQKEYGPKGVQIVTINTNSANQDYPADSYENMIKRANDKSFNFPYLDDADQSISRAYGAGRTPEIYLFNEERKLVYHGRINDNPKQPGEVSRHDLKEALDELIAGKNVSIPITNTLGCSIKFVN